MSAPRLSSARLLLAGLSILASASATAAPPSPWEFQDGDRIVFVGDTFVERDQRYGYLETVLTLANPDKDLTFRNLGWSGDTVRGLSRAGFDPPEAGFAQLKEQVLAAKPTVLVVGYGMADSFDGEAGLSRFVEGYNAFLDAVASTQARLVLLSPLPHEAMPAPLPDPSAHNRDLKLYAEAVGKIAEERGAAFIDLFTEVGRARAARAGTADSAPDTDNGLHPTALGFWRLATLPAVLPAQLADSDDSGVRRLPLPAAPGSSADPTGRWFFGPQGLAPGLYSLKVDGKAVATKSAEDWMRGHWVPNDPELVQVEALRAAINAKNLLFFYRWRPQNITYLFGFRKHEQGRNAVEIPQFDPLVDAKEREIAELRKPVEHTYELVREVESSR